MTLRTVVCDDEPPALELLCDLLRATGDVEIDEACQSVDAAIERINRGGIDLAVFDIEMPGSSGVEAWSQISVEPKPLLVFATAHPEYALEAFDIDAIDYLVKPLEQDRVNKAVEKAQRMHRLIASVQPEVPAESSALEQGETIKVRDGGRVHFIPYEEVTWIEAAGDYSLVHTADKEFAMRTTISALEKQLPDDRFVRIHRSTIIARGHVREARLLAKGEAMITLDTGIKVRASRSYRKVIRELTGG
ncbi:LytR/AlgR family response regulator transcription factor [Parvularcula lutaonensis]|uniref:LytR/AlgR family response regulator transcription factor n=1 Tax=Parvularcula lutaonensis TaxID=491923 RepID=A0ABV7MAQ2_9PROT|nr:LytTR family DNA-binding domain-containing protein [Parvularcula lutaonensis]GGY37863.1 DNA-binding response regulator [Parvularcula lutaonensis]